MNQLSLFSKSRQRCIYEAVLDRLYNRISAVADSAKELWLFSLT